MAVDMFLKLDGIDGESASIGHEKWIEIDSFSWGQINPAARPAGGMAAGKVSMSDLSFMHSYDKASPQLMTKCCQGQHIKDAKLTVRKAGGTQQDYLIYKMTDVIISSYRIGGYSDGVPMEQVSFNFSKFEIQYLDERTGETEVAGCGVKAR